MNIFTSNQYLSIASPAKINLFLEIHKRRDDGFHELETVMSKLSVFDQLVFRSLPDDCFRLTVQARPGIDALDIPSDENNLIIKALLMMRDLAGISCGAAIRLFKHIPVQAGLGGASGNAAAALVAANRMWSLNWPKERLFEVAGRIGSDVAFFLGDGLAICRGRGEQVQNLNYPCRLNVVVVKPAIGVSTKQIYSRCVVPDEPINSQTILTGLQSGQISKIGRALFNRLEQFESDDRSDTIRLRREFDKTNCVGHQLTGSGSCYFGIYRNRRSMVAAAKVLANRLPEMIVFTGQTLGLRNHCLKA